MQTPSWAASLGCEAVALFMCDAICGSGLLGCFDMLSSVAASAAAGGRHCGSAQLAAATKFKEAVPVTDSMGALSNTTE